MKHYKRLFIIWAMLFWAVVVAAAQNDTTIVFNSNHDGNREIYVMKSDDSNPVRLTFDSAEYLQLSGRRMEGVLLTYLTHPASIKSTSLII